MSFDNKYKVFDILQNVVTDQNSLVDIFINFDCDLEAIDLFRRIVDIYSKIAKVIIININIIF